MSFTYKSYSFVDKDPVINVIRTRVEDKNISLDWIAHHSGVSRTTIANWFYGNVKSPKHTTVAAVCRAIGLAIEFNECTSNWEDISYQSRIQEKFGAIKRWRGNKTNVVKFSRRSAT